VNATPIRQSIHLTRNGIPFDVAFSVDQTMRTAFSIICNELESGKRYNFVSKTYEDAK
jgi:hypothetical protein